MFEMNTKHDIVSENTVNHLLSKFLERQGSHNVFIDHMNIDEVESNSFRDNLENLTILLLAAFTSILVEGEVKASFYLRYFLYFENSEVLAKEAGYKRAVNFLNRLRKTNIKIAKKLGSYALLKELLKGESDDELIDFIDNFLGFGRDTLFTNIFINFINDDLSKGLLPLFKYNQVNNVMKIIEKDFFTLYATACEKAHISINNIISRSLAYNEVDNQTELKNQYTEILDEILNTLNIIKEEDLFSLVTKILVFFESKVVSQDLLVNIFVLINFRNLNKGLQHVDLFKKELSKVVSNKAYYLDGQVYLIRIIDKDECIYQVVMKKQPEVSNPISSTSTTQSSWES